MSKHNWHLRFLNQARLVAGWSKDPSTKVGAIITDEHHRVVSQGFNGFAKGIKDTTTRLQTRATKYRLVLHAECNAILFARRQLEGCTIYTWPIQPCATCASMLIQVGIQHVVSVNPSKDIVARWGEDIALAQDIMKEGQVHLQLLEMDISWP
jgi:dCMP deaminase